MNLTLERVQDIDRLISFSINLTSILATTAKVWSLASLPSAKKRSGKRELPLRMRTSPRHQTPTIQS